MPDARPGLGCQRDCRSSCSDLGRISEMSVPEGGLTTYHPDRAYILAALALRIYGGHFLWDMWTMKLELYQES